MVPKTNSGTIFLGVNNGGGGNFECEIGSFSIDHVAAAFQPLYTAVFNNATDYYAFGSPMPGRNFTSGNRYRYTFNGKEEDPETVGTAGGTQDYGFRIYNPSLGRFLSLDPLTSSYPELTPYQFASNTSIQATDLDGLEANYINIVNVNDKGTHYKDGRVFEDPDNGTKYTTGTTKIKGPNARDNFDQVNEIQVTVNKYGHPDYNIRTYKQGLNPASVSTSNQAIRVTDYPTLTGSNGLLSNINTHYQHILKERLSAAGTGNSIEVASVNFNVNGITDKKELQQTKDELKKYSKKTFGASVPVTFTTSEASAENKENLYTKDGTSYKREAENVKSVEMNITIKETTYSE